MQRLDGHAEFLVRMISAEPKNADAVNAVDGAPDFDPCGANRDLGRGANGRPVRIAQADGVDAQPARALRRAHGAQTGLDCSPCFTGEPSIRERGRKDNESVDLPVTHSERTRPSLVRPSPAAQFGGPSGGKLPSVPTCVTSW